MQKYLDIFVYDVGRNILKALMHMVKWEGEGEGEGRGKEGGKRGRGK
jgi:hypothetical protein